MAGLVSLIALTLAPLLLLGLAIPYAVLRLRDSRNVEHDPQLGMKAALYFSFSLAILISLTGLTVLVVDLFSGGGASFLAAPWEQPPNAHGLRPPEIIARPWEQPPKVPGLPTPPASPKGGSITAAQRNGGAMVVSGLILAVLHRVLIFGATNDRKRPEARRVFVGWRFAVHAVVVVFAVVALTMLVFQEHVDQMSLDRLLGVLAVWVPSWVIHLGLLTLCSRPRQVTPATVVPVRSA
jgi:hypothetical protein